MKMSNTRNRTVDVQFNLTEKNVVVCYAILHLSNSDEKKK